MDSGDDGRMSLERGDVEFKFPDTAQESLMLDGGISFIHTGGLRAGKLFRDAGSSGVTVPWAVEAGVLLRGILDLTLLAGKQTETVGTGAAGLAGSDKRALKV